MRGWTEWHEACLELRVLVRRPKLLRSSLPSVGSKMVEKTADLNLTVVGVNVESAARLELNRHP
ncbi:uncharacterized protein CTRU02_211728 [Colletotrichum truncatum]|uniref:Uncharacterized protein n=1 Tax=Colletotrichum truncatum TaxID=5467 RepID=A0ACC3YLH3_COLTU|nr:uncharacterized protein CTRU02_14752 [Colletotrichum truncatum]KAF6781875.1 hypothetical protein CTRU02_14752 [Colletotrichum truncatum]